MMNDELVGSRE